jgi:peptidyl-prolyl cis-trans isomerase C
VALAALCVAGAPACRDRQQAPTVPNDTVALVGDRPITAAQLQSHVDRLPPVLRAAHASAEQRRSLLEALIRNELLLQEARRLRLDQDPDFRSQVEQQLLARLLDETSRRMGAVTDSEVERFYRDHRSELEDGEMVRVSQIVLAERGEADKVVRAARALRPNDTKGFAALAARHSIDAPSRERAGDLGFLERGRFPHPAVGAAAFALARTGEVSEAIQTEQGYYVLRLGERKAPVLRPLADVKSAIQQRLLQERRTRQTEALLAESRARTKVQLFEGRLKSAPASDRGLAAAPR